jgi:hypothetical protein
MVVSLVGFNGGELTAKIAKGAKAGTMYFLTGGKGGMLVFCIAMNITLWGDLLWGGFGLSFGDDEMYFFVFGCLAIWFLSGCGG